MLTFGVPSDNMFADLLVRVLRFLILLLRIGYGARLFNSSNNSERTQNPGVR